VVTEPIITTRGLTKTYATRRGEISALHKVDLDVAPGTFTCVHGPSGSGKTTLLLAVGGMLHPSSGSIQLLGRDLYAMARSDRAKVRSEHVGFVFQLFHLVPYLDVIENVRLGGGDGSGDDARALLRDLGLEGRETHRPSELSAGERQRVALGRALVRRPSLILADEPTGNLDPENSVEVLRHLSAFRDAGGTVLMVSHGSDADAYADRVLHLRDGSVSEDAPGAPSAVARRPT
jgi:ABC-type lipoprotein export system ATPase subunit